MSGRSRAEQCGSNATNAGAGGIADGDRFFNAATVEALKAQDVRDFLARDGAEPLGSTPEQMKRYFASETAKYVKLVRASKGTAE
jgi:tripartite-type tricarboxylate transporter receptor subunit TctC